MRSKRQMTMAKMAREQALRERRLRKQDKKEARRNAAAEPGTDTAAAVSQEEPATADGD